MKLYIKYIIFKYIMIYLLMLKIDYLNLVILEEKVNKYYFL